MQGFSRRGALITVSLELCIGAVKVSCGYLPDEQFVKVGFHFGNFQG